MLALIESISKRTNIKLVVCLVFSLLQSVSVLADIPTAGFSVVDQHQHGTKYSPLRQINKNNVAQLEIAWQVHTGDLPPEGHQGLFSFQDHPSMIEGNLVICTPLRRVIALDPATGEKRWEFDAKEGPSTTLKCRGISNWVDQQSKVGSECHSRIFMGTSDYRLLAIDAKSGKPCSSFGENGAVKMPVSKPIISPGEVSAGSNPAVVNDVVVVGSAITDNQRTAPPSGRVLAFDARTGEQLWDFDPIPRDNNDPAMTSWKDGTDDFGHGNVWNSMAVDQTLDMVYLPTTSPSDDHFGGEREGDNNYTSSVVALRGSTGELVWHYQLVHHNVFDYDIASRPMLIDYPHNGQMVPALVQNTKQGMIFIFNRETGEPLVPIVERPVPQDHSVAGEVLSPTQPFPEGMPAVAKHGFSPDDVWGFTPLDKWLCKREAEKYRYGPIYTPPSAEGTILMPSAGGGPNWGGGAYDPESHIMVVPSNEFPMIIKLIPRAQVGDIDGISFEGVGHMIFENSGSAYAYEMQPLFSIFGAPCSEPPWSTLNAVDLVEKKLLWRVPLGSIKELSPVPIDWHLGSPGSGGPLITASGLVFIGYSTDNTLRAFDLHSGDILWESDLPAPANSIPVTYSVNGEQYLVVPAGGHSVFGNTFSDVVIAYRLPSKAPN